MDKEETSVENPQAKHGQVNLAAFHPGDFDRGASKFKEALWLILRPVFFRWLPGRWNGLKCWVLRRFGARIGKCVVLKPGVIINLPWKLTVGDHVWIGEESWLLCLAPIVLEDHVVVSHRVFLCTGNHDYTSPRFDLRVQPIHVHRGAWLTAGTMVGPGVAVGTHAILTMGSVATKNLDPYGIYRGNPAKRVGWRRIRDA